MMSMIDQETITSTERLAKIPSTADNPQALLEAVDFIATMLDKPNITIERFMQNKKPSLLAYYGPQRPEKFDILFNGHIDVVPGKPEQFVPYQDGDRLYGRGIYDMKAACIVMTDVFRKHNPNSPICLGLQIVADEEVGGYDGAVVQLQDNLRADFIVTGEMTDNEICTETRGLCWLDVTFKGTGAHSGYAWEGDNALVKASTFVQKLMQKYPTPTERTWTTTANIAAITSNNTAYNQVPKEATVRVDFRFVPEDSVFANKESVIAFLRSIDSSIAIRFENFEPAVEVPHDNPYLLQFARAYRQAIGEDPTFIRRYASSDARHFALAGQHCIEFGPVGKHLHGDNEYLELSSLVPFRKTLEAFLANQ